jgi:tRNA(Ile)-lysidine synthase
MALLHFVRQAQRRDVIALMFNHGTGLHEGAHPRVRAFCEAFGIRLIVGKGVGEPDAGKSPEEHWRDNRYAWLESWDRPVLTGHNLDDVAETWLWGAVNGQTKLIPSTRNNILRPLLAVEKSELETYCEQHTIPTWLDPSNAEPRYARCRTRERLVPAALYVNPGFKSMLRRRLLERRNQERMGD